MIETCRGTRVGVLVTAERLPKWTRVKHFLGFTLVAAGLENCSLNVSLEWCCSRRKASMASLYLPASLRPFCYMFQLNDLSLRVRWCGPQSHLLDHRTMFTRSHTMELRIHVCSP